MNFSPKLIRRLIGCIYFVTAAIIYSIQVAINVLYYGIIDYVPFDYFSGATILWSRPSDMFLFFLAVLFCVLGIYYTFFSKLGEPKNKPS